MKKLITMLILLLCSITTAWAVVEFNYKGAGAYDLRYTVNDDNTSVTCTGMVNRGDAGSANLVIPESVSNGSTTYSVTSIGMGAFYDCHGFTGSLTIGSGVTSIGDMAFTGCSNITSIVMLGAAPTTSMSFMMMNNCSKVIVPAEHVDSYGVVGGRWEGFTIQARTAAQAAKIAQVNALDDGLTQTDYTVDSWAIFQTAMQADIDAIDACDTDTKVEDYVLTADVAVLVNAPSVASVTFGGTTTEYTVIDLAWAAAISNATTAQNKATITLLADCSTKAKSFVNAEDYLVLNTNAKTLTFTDYTKESRIDNSNGALDITGSGNIIGAIWGHYAKGIVAATGGTLTLSDATIENKDDKGSLAVCVSGSSATFKMLSGTLKSGGSSVLSVPSGSPRIELYSGKIVGFVDNSNVSFYLMPSAEPLTIVCADAEEVFGYIDKVDCSNVEQFSVKYSTTVNDANPTEATNQSGITAETNRRYMIIGERTISLVGAKTAAKASLSSYADKTDYRTAEQATLTTAITNGNTAIDKSTDIAGVTQALADAKAVIDAIKTNALLTAEEALATANTTAKATLSNYVNADDYRTAEQEDLATAITNGNKAIENATDIAGVTKALADAKAVIDAIKTDAQLTAEEALASAKTTAKASLLSYADADDYRAAEQATLTAAIENGNTAIDKSTDIAGVTKSLADAKAVIDAIKTDAELTAEEDTTTVKPPVEPEDTTTVIPPVEPEDTTTVTPPVEPEDTTTVDPTPEPEDTTTVTPPVEPEDTTTVDQTPEVYTITADLKGGKLPADVVIPTTYTIATEDIVLPTTLTMAPDTMMSTELITSVMVYKFAGWVDANKKAITTIAKGTTGNITLTATWTAETIVGLIDQVKEESYNSDVLVVGPMPINNKSKVFYTVEEAGVYTLELYNLAEKLMSTTKVEAQDGRNITNWTALQMLPKGVYYIAVKKDREFISLRRIVK